MFKIEDIKLGGKHSSVFEQRRAFDVHERDTGISLVCNSIPGNVSNIINNSSSSSNFSGRSIGVVVQFDDEKSDKRVNLGATTESYNQISEQF